MRRRGISKNDRKVMIVLVLLLAGLGTYLGVRESRAGRIMESHNDSVMVAQVDTIMVVDTLVMMEQQQAILQKDTMPITTARYPGPPKRVKYPSKLKEGATIDLNSADTLLLMRVPGIGSSFARRICKYRELLGGYYVVEQLQEVYGMDRERYDQIAPFMRIETPVKPLVISGDSIPKHPYLAWRHINQLRDLIRAGEEVNWSVLMDSGAFSRDDSLRLAPYVVFQFNNL